jgi:hypothetical protein
MVRRYPDVVNRWDTALPILRAWKFDEPRDYTTFGGHRELVELARNQRGQLIQVKEPGMAGTSGAGSQGLRARNCNSRTRTM